MTNDEARILIERILLVPVAEVDAALILAGIEERLRNESRPTPRVLDLLPCGHSYLSTALDTITGETFCAECVGFAPVTQTVRQIPYEK